MVTLEWYPKSGYGTSTHPKDVLAECQHKVGMKTNFGE